MRTKKIAASRVSTAQPGATGAPLLAGAVANLDCRISAVHEAGDHIIYVGEVVGLRVAGGEPLLHCDRRYRSLAD
jgi:flavin reductase (DIM6/NTAB) family NADH-FMN oxidoreductase RutF